MKHACKITLPIAAVIMSLLVSWIAGYNFDSRGGGALMALALAAIGAYFGLVIGIDIDDSRGRHK